MEDSTSAMMIRDVPIDLRMRLKALAAMQHRRLRAVWGGVYTRIVGLKREKPPESLAREGEPLVLSQTTTGLHQNPNIVGLCASTSRKYNYYVRYDVSVQA
jgi:hypothetical protein